jgi:hypothetical protein
MAAITRAADDEWREAHRRAAASLNADLFLGAIEFEARRLTERGELGAARDRWRSLRARAEELGYRPVVEEANGWLNEPPVTTPSPGLVPP